MSEPLNSAATKVVSSMTLVMDRFIELVHEEIPNAKFVYDEKLTYESALESFRANTEMNDENSDFFPLFSFRRSVLRYAKDGQGRRSVVDRVKRRADEQGGGQSEVFRMLNGEFDLDFIYYTKKADDLERFELAYLSEEGFPQIKELKINFTHAVDGMAPAVLQGEYPYKFRYSDLEDKQMSKEDAYYKAVTGKITVQGHHFVFRNVAKHILEINAFLKDINTKVILGERHITSL